MTDPLSKNLQVVVLGGYGFFGSRIVTLLAREAGLTVWVAGRDAVQAQALVDRLQAQPTPPPATLAALHLDAHAGDLSRRLETLGAQLLIHTCGPFQGQDYQVAQACIAAGCHYVDLADGRGFVQGIATLDAAARARGVLVCSGASSVCGVSGAVVAALAASLQVVEAVDIAISIGNQTARGLATVQAILSYCGESIPAWRGGRLQPVTGWGQGGCFEFAAPVGRRAVADCDVPDTVVLPSRYPQLHTVQARAGLELPLLQGGMRVLAWLRRWRLAPNWARWARLLKWLSERLMRFGSDRGAMAVVVRGRDAQGTAQTLSWQLLALQGDGQYVPALCSVALVRRLRHTGHLPAGAMPAPAGLTLDEIEQAALGLAIQTGWGPKT